MPSQYRGGGLAEPAALDRRQTIDAIIEAIDLLAYTIKGRQSRAPDGDDLKVLVPIVNTIGQRFTDLIAMHQIGRDGGRTN